LPARAKSQEWLRWIAGLPEPALDHIFQRRQFDYDPSCRKGLAERSRSAPDRSSLRFSTAGSKRAALLERARHRHPALEHAGNDRAAAAISGRARIAPKRGANERYLRAHSKYF